MDDNTVIRQPFNQADTWSSEVTTEDMLSEWNGDLNNIPLWIEVIIEMIIEEQQELNEMKINSSSNEGNSTALTTKINENDDFTVENTREISEYIQWTPEMLYAQEKGRSNTRVEMVADEFREGRSKYSEECSSMHCVPDGIYEDTSFEETDHFDRIGDHLSTVGRDGGVSTNEELPNMKSGDTKESFLCRRLRKSGCKQWPATTEKDQGREAERSCGETVAQQLQAVEENSKYSEDCNWKHSVQEEINEDLDNGKEVVPAQNDRQHNNDSAACGEEQLSNVSKDQNGDKRYLCDRCGRCFSQKHSMMRHQLIHADQKPFKCSECDKTFRGREDLKFHEVVHRKERNSKFEVCGKALKKSSKHSQERYSKHSTRNERNDLSNGKRDHFVATAMQLSGVRRVDSVPSDKEQFSNLKRGETGGPPYRCDICGKLFSRKNNFVAHHVVHRKEKPFMCNKCGKTFKRELTFREHERVHSEERNYKCDTCGKAFKHPGSLRVHMTSHSEERPHKCKNCSKAFKTKNNLKKHQMLNCGGRP